MKLPSRDLRVTVQSEGKKKKIEEEQE